MSNYGYHWTPCNRGGGGLAVLVLALIIIAAAIARPAAHAADEVGHVVLEALEITAIVLVSAAGLAVLGGMAYGAHRAYRWHVTNRQAVVSHTPAIQRGSEALSATTRARAIETGRVIDGVVIHDGAGDSHDQALPPCVEDRPGTGHPR